MIGFVIGVAVTLVVVYFWDMIKDQIQEWEDDKSPWDGDR